MIHEAVHVHHISSSCILTLDSWVLSTSWWSVKTYTLHVTGSILYVLFSKVSSYTNKAVWNTFEPQTRYYWENSLDSSSRRTPLRNPLLNDNTSYGFGLAGSNPARVRAVSRVTAWGQLFAEPHRLNSDQRREYSRVHVQIPGRSSCSRFF